MTGGYAYRGKQMRDFSGAYFYADYCTARLKILVRDGEEWRNVSLTPTYRYLSTFGEDADGELYFAIRSHEGVNDRDAGKIYRIHQEWRQQIPVVMAGEKQ